MAERGGGEEITGIIPFQEYAAAAATDFGIVDFTDNDLDQLIQLIQVQNHIFYLDDHHMSTADVVGGCLGASGQLFPTIEPPPENHDQLFVGFDEAALMSAAAGQVITNNNDIISPGFSAANDHRQFQNDTVPERDDDDDDDDDDIVYGEAESSETATNYSSEKKQKKGDHKSDRTKTLISERRRRGRMKEKLYALRALVPYITKMDKASIVGDAVLYVQDLQMQAKKLKSEISGLESSLLTGGVNNSNNNKHQGRDIVHNSNKTNATTFHPTIKKIIKMDVFQVEDRGFYVRVVLKKGKGVAVLIYRALESITTYDVRSSNLAADSDNYVFTFTLHIREGDHQVDMNLACLKMWVARVFLVKDLNLKHCHLPNKLTQ